MSKLPKGAYKGWICLYKHDATSWNPHPFYEVYSGRKTEDELDYFKTAQKVTLDHNGIVGPYFKWHGQRWNSSQELMAFENRVFKCKFELGSPKQTAASCEVSLTCKDFKTSMYLPDLWPFLERVTYDTSDPANVKKYIEGDFVFVKRGQAVAVIFAIDETP
jgi:hypothetical protein